MTDNNDPIEEVQLSPNGLRVLEARYLKRGSGGGLEETPSELFHRVGRAVAEAERAYGTNGNQIEDLACEYHSLMASGTFLPNSPTLMNAGRDGGMLSACFVIPIEDSLDSIFAAVHKTALIQKAGGGTGYSFSQLRPKGDRVASSGGVTSGPISFMRVFAEATNAIQQGAFRRGANMGIMRVDHPDIVDFINAKREPGELSNFNISVAVTDDFVRFAIKSPDTPHIVVNPRTGEKQRLRRDNGYWTVGALLDLIVTRAWESGEPGVVFIDAMNRVNPTPMVGAFESTNACGEQPLLAYESCNLGSINLTRFVRATDGQHSLDMEALGRCARKSTRFLDNVIDAARFPLPEFEDAAQANRKIGLGVMGFADALFMLEIPYDSEDALDLASDVMRTVNEESHAASAELAEHRGCFPNWEGSTWAAKGLRMRNACTTCVAPTGSISIIAGCSGGIEPAFALAFKRRVLDGSEMTELNPVFASAVRESGVSDIDEVAKAASGGSIQTSEMVPEELKRIFVTAHDISPEWHVRMQAAFQEHCDASISKTINLAHGAASRDVRNALLLAHELGCKGVTVYRDGCRPAQPMAVAPQGRNSATPVKPMELPDIMPAVRIKQVTPFGNMHVKVVIDPKANVEREVFAQLGRGGDLANADLEAICRLISLYLRVGGSLDDVVNQLRSIGSSLSIPTREGRITSLADGLAHAIHKYQAHHGKAKESSGGIIPRRLFDKVVRPAMAKARKDAASEFKIKCPEPECTGYLSFQEGCALCHACGFSLC